MRQLLQLFLEEFFRYALICCSKLNAAFFFEFQPKKHGKLCLTYVNKPPTAKFGAPPEGLASAGSGNIRFRGPGSWCEGGGTAVIQWQTLGQRRFCVAQICDATTRQDKVKDINRLYKATQRGEISCVYV